VATFGTPGLSAPKSLGSPLILYIAVGDFGKATGRLYQDDGESFAYERGEYAWIQFSYEKGVFHSRWSDGRLKPNGTIAKIVIFSDKVKTLEVNQKLSDHIEVTNA
jgi:alpha 1,3-glucosidase